MEKKEELEKLREELKDVRFAVHGGFNPNNVEELREIKQFIDHIKK